MRLSLFSDLIQMKEEEDFLNSKLHISTKIKFNTVDDLLDFCLSELELYSIPFEMPWYEQEVANYYSGDNPELANPYCLDEANLNDRRNEFNKCLKDNCLITAYYTLAALKQLPHSTEFHTLVKKEMDLERYVSEIRNSANTALRNSSSDTYTNHHIFSTIENEKTNISSFCKDLSLQLIFNHQRNLQNSQRTSIVKFGNFIKFDFDGALSRFNKFKRPDCIKPLKADIINFISGLNNINNTWKCNSSDELDKLCYYYRKEHIFHCHALLGYISCSEQDHFLCDYYLRPNPRSTYRFPISPFLFDASKCEQYINWVDKLHHWLSLPIVHHHMKLLELNPHLISEEEAMITAYVRLPILYKTFFLSYINKFSSLDEALMVLGEYLRDNPIKDFTNATSSYSNSYAKAYDIVPEVNAQVLKVLENVLLYRYQEHEPYKLILNFDSQPLPDGFSNINTKYSAYLLYELKARQYVLKTFTDFRNKKS